MTPKNKVPKDLGLKMGTELEIFWGNVRDAAKATIADAEKTILLQKAVMLMAEKNRKAEAKESIPLNNSLG